MSPVCLSVAMRCLSFCRKLNMAKDGREEYSNQAREGVAVAVLEFLGLFVLVLC